MGNLTSGREVVPTGPSELPDGSPGQLSKQDPVFQSGGSLWKAPGAPAAQNLWGKWDQMAERRSAPPLWPVEGREGKELRLEEKGDILLLQRCVSFRAHGRVWPPAECEIYVGRVLERRGKLWQRGERERAVKRVRRPWLSSPYYCLNKYVQAPVCAGWRQEAGGAWKPLSDCRHCCLQGFGGAGWGVTTDFQHKYA